VKTTRGHYRLYQVPATDLYTIDEAKEILLNPALITQGMRTGSTLEHVSLTLTARDLLASGSVLTEEQLGPDSLSLIDIMAELLRDELNLKLELCAKLTRLIKAQGASMETIYERSLATVETNTKAVTGHLLAEADADYTDMMKALKSPILTMDECRNLYQAVKDKTTENRLDQYKLDLMYMRAEGFDIDYLRSQLGDDELKTGIKRLFQGGSMRGIRRLWCQLSDDSFTSLDEKIKSMAFRQDNCPTACIPGFPDSFYKTPAECVDDKRHEPALLCILNNMAQAAGFTSFMDKTTESFMYLEDRP
jgi:hypothetical protein